TARLMFAPTGAFLLFLVIACSAPARAAQMEGPTVYGVEPTLAVITNDGSEAYYIDNSALIQLNLKRNTTAKIDLDEALTGTLFGVAPNGELIGYSETSLWAFDPARRTVKVIFAAPPDEKIRYATVQPSTRTVWVSLAP